jgi:N-acetylglucosamine-6-sulfatase
MHAIRTDRYKYIRPHGVWDVGELYDLRADPGETTNLISRAEHRALAEALDDRLFTMLERGDGLRMPLRRGREASYPGRRRDGARQADFPDAFFRPPPGP